MFATARSSARWVVGAVAAVAIASCGLATGRGSSDVTLTVTSGFGTTQLGSVTAHRVSGSETVLRMLERSFRVSTRDPGGSVESIDGLSVTSSGRDWAYYVNGVQAPIGPAKTAIHGGDRIWWDLHDGSGADTIPAVVGSFPEPFVHGTGGRRLPTELECAGDVGAACKQVSNELAALGIPVATQLFGTGSGTDSLAVVVGTWRDVHDALLAAVIEHGPSASGVYARFAGPGGDALQLLDPRGRVVRTLGAGAGLIAATASDSSQPTWVITGTDRAGVTAAAAALTAPRLHDHFALAVQGASAIPLPLRARFN